eukprot:gnl/MRDRNA2_/MRDRNA2_293344_c0_seq1.p1 gnl/MRDRNA2_/MRDRNA2_293344_c0~~gnl/MRDRNA2_/MRDRNA2_293344_c0_seq1.p1  ORF type:complete len:465 (+),score=70.96 gnl/MRDRNA2_/MRDRNA2_293344_c0_seq1:163-1395(+)
MWALLRNTVLRHLHLKKQLDPESMNIFHHILHSVDEHHLNHFTFDRVSQTIDMSKLTSDEREFFLTSLTGTLRCYIASMDFFDLHLVNAAIEEAFERCRWNRRHQQSTYAKKHGIEHPKAKGEHVQAWYASLKREIQEVEKKAEGASGLQERHWLAEDKLKDREDAMGYTVEELQNALMILWPDILAQSPQLTQRKQMIGLEGDEGAESDQPISVDQMLEIATENLEVSSRSDVMSSRDLRNTIGPVSKSLDLEKVSANNEHMEAPQRIDQDGMYVDLRALQHQNEALLLETFTLKAKIKELEFYEGQLELGKEPEPGSNLKTLRAQDVASSSQDFVQLPGPNAQQQGLIDQRNAIAHGSMPEVCESAGPGVCGNCYNYRQPFQAFPAASQLSAVRVYFSETSEEETLWS